MNRVIRLTLVLAVVAAIATPVAAQQAQNQPAPNPLVQLLQSKGILTAEEAASVRTASTAGEANERLAHLLLSKGLISQEEYNSTAAASAMPVASDSAGGAHLVNAATSASPVAEPVRSAAPAPVKSAPWPVSPAMVGYDPSDGTAADATVIPAIAPVRVLPIGIPRDPKGIIPDIKLGSGALLNIYGFLKASAVYDTTNSGGSTFGSNDFPLPLLLGDTGPDKGAQTRFKARSARAGVNFAWPINGPNLTLTGKVEFDWEGDYTIVNNRNISSIRSSQLSLRLAWARLDGKFGTVPWFAEFGQDWTLLGSSTLLDLFETTGLGVGFGDFYERIPQFKTGLQFTAGRFKIEPELAVTLGAFGDSGLNSSTTSSIFGSLGQIPTGQQNQGREGAILGPASTSPGIQGRLVFDFPLNKGWKGVPNAEIIFSGGHAEAEEIVPVGNIPTTAVAALTVPTGTAPVGLSATACSTVTPAGFSVRCYYPTGLGLQIPQNAWSAEAQLPTPWFTVIGKYYRGGDLRFMFAGQLNTAFADLSVGTPLAIPGTSVLCTAGTAGCVGGAAGPPAVAGTASLAQTVFSLAGDPITFRNSNITPGTAVVAPLRPIRGQGGLLQLGFPLSRIFGANPEGLNSGWRLFVGYGIDSAFNRDVTTSVHCAVGSRGCSAAGTVARSGGNGLRRSDYAPVSLRYRINKWAEIVNEVTWYDTRTAGCAIISAAAACNPLPAGSTNGVQRVLFRGVDARVNHDIREEFGTIFTF